MKKYFQILTLVTFVMTLAACSGKKDEAATHQQEEKPKVKLAQAISRDVEQTEEYTAIVESDVKNNISSNTKLRIEKILVEVGDYVRKGQTLVQMDASDLHQLKLQIENQRVEFNRVDQLYKVGGASKAEWDNAKTQLDINETLYNNKVINTRLISPISGVVTARNYDNGDMADTNPILTVESVSPAKMVISISETYYPSVKVGMKVEVKLDTYKDEMFSGRITLVHPTIDPSTHTFTVEITLSDARQRIRPGMFARATLNFGTENHVVVPDVAVVKQMGAGDRYVYVYNNGKVSHNKVVVGRRLGNEYEIIEGLSPNTQVVVAGQIKLTDNAAVEVVK